MLRIHEADDPDELSDIELLADEWGALRAVLKQPPRSRPRTARRRHGAPRPLPDIRDHLRALVDREATDAVERSDASAGVTSQTTSALLTVSAVIIALLVGLGLLGNRRIRREIEPAQDQVEFADTLQLAESEDEAHQLLQLRLLRIVPDSFVTVLNRNNSADRLEPMTDVPPDSELADVWNRPHPVPAWPSVPARPHDEDPGDRAARLRGMPAVRRRSRPARR